MQIKQNEENFEESDSEVSAFDDASINWLFELVVLTILITLKSFIIIYTSIDNMFNTDNIFHPNSLLFNGLPIMWPLKVYWAGRKVSDS